MQEMSALELHEYLQSKDNTPLLLDVREPWEFNLCRIEGSTLIPMQSMVREYKQLEPEQETVVICHHGIRSRMVGQFLEQQADFTNIINLSGGVNQWAQQIDPDMPIY